MFLKTVIRDVPFQSSDVPNVQQGALNSTSGTAPIFISTWDPPRSSAYTLVMKSAEEAEGVTSIDHVKMMT